MASEGSPGTTKRRGTTRKMDDTASLLAAASSTSRIRQSPIALCLFQQGLVRKVLSGDRNRFSPMRMLRPMARPPSPTTSGTSSMSATFATSMTPSSGSPNRQISSSSKTSGSTSPAGGASAAAGGRSHLSQFWHHPCLHRVEKGTRRIFSCGPLRRVPKICLVIGEKVPLSLAFDGVAVLQSDESFANPGRQGLPQRREACVDGWSGSHEVLRQHLYCHVFQAPCSCSLLQWSVVRHIKLLRERGVVWRDVGQMNPGQLLFPHLSEGCRNVGWRTIKDENAGAHHQACALQNPERRAGSLLCSSGFHCRNSAYSLGSQRAKQPVVLPFQIICATIGPGPMGTTTVIVICRRESVTKDTLVAPFIRNQWHCRTSCTSSKRRAISRIIAIWIE